MCGESPRRQKLEGNAQENQVICELHVGIKWARVHISRIGFELNLS